MSCSILSPKKFSLVNWLKWIFIFLITSFILLFFGKSVKFVEHNRSGNIERSSFPLVAQKHGEFQQIKFTIVPTNKNQFAKTKKAEAIIK